MQDALLAMFVLNRGRLVGHLYLGSTLADAVRSNYSAERHLPPHSALTPRLVPKSQPLDLV